MVDLVERRLWIERRFEMLESFWEEELPDAIENKDNPDFDMLNFTLEAGLPNEYYAHLIKELGEDLKSDYAERLAGLDALIAQNEPGLKQLLDEVYHPRSYTDGAK